MTVDAGVFVTVGWRLACSSPEALGQVRFLRIAGRRARPRPHRQAGPARVQAGRKAVRRAARWPPWSAPTWKFHGFIYTLSRSTLVAPAKERHRACTQRVMGAALMRDERARAETLARRRVDRAAN